MGLLRSIFCSEGRKDLLVLLDGDKRPDEPIKGGAEVAGMTLEQLDAEILRITGVRVNFNVDGNGVGVTAQKLRVRREFIAWVDSCVRYLPGRTPEDYIWSKIALDHYQKNACNGADAKSNFSTLARLELGLDPEEELTSGDILATQKRRLATVEAEDEDLIAVKRYLEDAYGRFRAA